jgi:hypothetical protein
LQNLRADLNSLQDVASRQASLRVPGLPTSERVAAYLELSAASFTRTLSAVYARSILELFVDVQVAMSPRNHDESRSSGAADTALSGTNAFEPDF